MPKQVSLNVSAIDDKNYRDSWVDHIEGKPVSEVKIETKQDINGDTAGKQADYEGGVYVYESYEVFLKRAAVWASTHFTDEDIREIIDRKKTDEVTAREEIDYVEEGKDKAVIVERIIEKWGVEHGHYEKIHTLPDGSIFVKLKG